MNNNRGGSDWGRVYATSHVPLKCCVHTPATCLPFLFFLPQRFTILVRYYCITYFICFVES
jgi:hypothetical protein